MRANHLIVLLLLVAGPCAVGCDLFVSGAGGEGAPCRDRTDCNQGFFCQGQEPNKTCTACSNSWCGDPTDGCCIEGCPPGVDPDCNAECDTVQNCISGDGCCPIRCEYEGDTDCVSTCTCAAGDCCDPTCMDMDPDCEGPCARVFECIDDDGCCPWECELQGDSDCGVDPCQDATCEQAQDGCCPEGCTFLQDFDCDPCAGTPVCGDDDGCCPAACDSSQDLDCCLLSALCDDQTPDGCCPAVCAGMVPSADADCDLCGNGVLDAPAETCDPGVGSGCPVDVTSCDDGMACTLDVFLQGGTECQSRCLNVPAACGPDDECCPPGCNQTQATLDPNCPAFCGNGVTEAGETCDGDCPESVADCDDELPCTTDTLEGSATECTAACVHDPITACDDGTDGCCPAGSCNATTDPDCDPVCGNGVLEDGELCDGAQFATPAFCSDLEPDPYPYAGSVGCHPGTCLPDTTTCIQAATVLDLGTAFTQPLVVAVAPEEGGQYWVAHGDGSRDGEVASIEISQVMPPTSVGSPHSFTDIAFHAAAGTSASAFYVADANSTWKLMWIDSAWSASILSTDWGQPGAARDQLIATESEAGILLAKAKDDPAPGYRSHITLITPDDEEDDSLEFYSNTRAASLAFRSNPAGTTRWVAAGGAGVDSLPRPLAVLSYVPSQPGEVVYDPMDLQGHTLEQVAFSHDAGEDQLHPLLAYLDSDMIHLRTTNGWVEVDTIASGGSVKLAFHPRLSLLVVGHPGGSVELILVPASIAGSTAHHNSLLSIDAGLGDVEDIAFSPDGRVMAVAHKGQGTRSIEVFDVAKLVQGVGFGGPCKLDADCIDPWPVCHSEENIGQYCSKSCSTDTDCSGITNHCGVNCQFLDPSP